MEASEPALALALDFASVAGKNPQPLRVVCRSTGLNEMRMSVTREREPFDELIREPDTLSRPSWVDYFAAAGLPVGTRATTRIDVAANTVSWQVHARGVIRVADGTATIRPEIKGLR